MPTYRIAVPGQPEHTTGLSIDEAVEFAFGLGGFDRGMTRSKLERFGKCELSDDAGLVVIEAEKPAHNVIYSAALLAKHTEAAMLLRGTLGISDADEMALHVDEELLNHPVPWSRTEWPLRCQRISLWLRNECFRTIEVGRAVQ